MIKKHYKTIWISDIHLGTVASQTESLLNFLKYNTCDTLYLVGDIIDFWALKRHVYFPNSHLKILKWLIKHATKNTKIIYITGNHDEVLRIFTPIELDNIKIKDEDIYTTVNNKKLLILHGDIFDPVVNNIKWLAYAGDIGYTILLKMNVILNKIRKLFHLPFWSLSNHIKQKVKTAVKFIANYEEIVSKTASLKKVNGIICGHIHHAELYEKNNIFYANCGDWVESKTAIAEDIYGNFHLIDWNEIEKQNFNSI